MPDDAAIYLGGAGTTRTTNVHYTCRCGAAFAARVYRSVDVSANPDLRTRALSAEPATALTTARCPSCDERVWISMPFVYHDPKHWLFVLVLPEALRHRALEERAALLGELAADPAAVPEYVSRFDTVFGPAGLVEYVKQKAELAVAARAGRPATDPTQDARDRAREAELSTAATRVEQARAELAATRRDLEARASGIAEREAELSRREAALGQRDEDAQRRELTMDERARRLDERERDLDEHSAALTLRMKAISDIEAGLAQREQQPPNDSTSPFDLFEPGDLIHEQRDATDHRDDPDHDEVAELDPEDLVPVGADALDHDGHGDHDGRDGHAGRARRPSTGDEITNTAPVGDAAIERWIASRETTLKLVADGKVRLAVCVEHEELDNLLADDLELRVQLHRFPSFPLVILALGTPDSLRGAAGTREPIAIPFDVSAEPDRGVLQALAGEFSFTLELYDTDYLQVRKRRVHADLAGNVRYVLAAADEHAAGIDPHDRSFGRAAIAFTAPGCDRYGWHHPERAQFDEATLADLSTPRAVLRAIALADRFSDPVREEYLFLIRGYSMQEWTTRRRAALERAVELGLWMGPRLAHVAVSEGLARSRKSLVAGLERSFAQLLSDPAAAGSLDDGAIRGNWAELKREATALGLTVGDAPSLGHGERASTRSEPRDSESEPAVSGTIPGAPLRDLVAAGMGNRTVDELLAALEVPEHRVEAALELARRGERRAIEPVLDAAMELSRNEAVRVLGYAVSFGDRATGRLIQALESHKGYIRQGAALALSVLKNEEAVEALADLVIAEPTAIWKEVARALGQVGPRAIMPLASRLGDGDKGTLERLAWALAHIVARGGRMQVETLAGGRDPVAAGVASHALELADLARSDDLQVRGNHTPRDHTVNRAFSRRFFQALEASVPIVEPQELDNIEETSGPAMLLDEADLLEAADLQELDDDDRAEVLDDKDLIPT